MTNKEKNSRTNCISINRPNIFDYSNNNENLFDKNSESVEKEGEYIFNAERLSGTCNYNYNDAKELEYQFNQIQKD